MKCRTHFAYSLLHRSQEFSTFIIGSTVRNTRRSTAQGNRQTVLVGQLGNIFSFVFKYSHCGVLVEFGVSRRFVAAAVGAGRCCTAPPLVPASMAVKEFSLYCVARRERHVRSSHEHMSLSILMIDFTHGHPLEVCRRAGDRRYTLPWRHWQVFPHTHSHLCTARRMPKLFHFIRVVISRASLI